MTLLNGDKLTLCIDDRPLVRAVSLAVRPGEVLAIIGPNGAGKTTLLRALSGDLTPTEGQVTFNGRALADWPARERALALAVLTQANSLTFGFTVAEVVSLGRTPHSTGAVVDHRVCRAAMKALDVLHLAERAYPSLSGGEQQRVQLARVMAQIWRPDGEADRLLLLDEPVTSLDLGHQRQLMQAVRDFADSGVGVVMVVHDISLAAAYSDHLLALKDGAGVAYGRPEQVVTEAQISDLFDSPVRVIAHPDTGKPVVLAN
ncbi:heme ABC transporter ATP-binding protein [Marinimicrobium alkaliphilum]|uniref:heme ABC transporter ATP-binding protein n=1 Tax=Marinimicrobium alkaliphilum TaxID=2202654 RepID=UPI000DBA304C|nr:heme ABC transporter ATP-binding protein [Marinimicrobium alkaliphilum]